MFVFKKEIRITIAFLKHWVTDQTKLETRLSVKSLAMQINAQLLFETGDYI